MVHSQPIQHCSMAELDIYILARLNESAQPVAFDELIHSVQSDALAAGYFPPTVSQVSEQILAAESARKAARYYVGSQSMWWARHEISDQGYRDLMAVLRDVAGVSQEFAGVDLRELIARLEVAG